MGATLVNYGVMSGEACQLPGTVIIFKDITVRGFWLAKWFQTATPQRQQEVFANITGLVASGQLSAPIHACYPVSDIKAAVAAAAAGERHGKIILVGEQA